MGTISLYAGGAAWRGGLMAELAESTARGTEISERSTELVLPDATASEWKQVAPLEIDDCGADLDGAAARAAAGAANCERGVSVSELEATTTRETQSERSARGPAASSAIDRPPARAGDTPAAAKGEDPTGGLALPGDRGPRDQATEGQRPSFWRRIALGRRAAKQRQHAMIPPANSVTPASATAAGTQTPSPATAAPVSAPIVRAATITPTPNLEAGAQSEMIEKRVVEPMLQALVSVEAKLERSHADLSVRSDNVEQRLTQLWDIEEQLGALGEIQESLLQVSEQQRRLESALVGQTRTLRWMIGAVIASMVAAAFVVAAMLR